MTTNHTRPKTKGNRQTNRSPAQQLHLEKYKAKGSRLAANRRAKKLAKSKDPLSFYAIK
jgi:hypothetical protein|tara:strand:- start:116 stop:292 length:177 start_codon:yes stop_codon:yes gene_type:complete